MKKALCVFGTRPEVIKMAPVIKEMRKNEDLNLRVLSTSQHRDMLDQMLNLFEIKPDIDLNVMKMNQTLPQLTANLPLPLDETLKREKPDIVLAQGDTTTAFMVSLACFYQQIPFAHVEAGLRTGIASNPFPEEMNRVLISRLSSLNFSPTDTAKENLLREGYPQERIFVTGNTVIDALYDIISRKIPLDERIDLEKRLILVTAHRRENFGQKLENICSALKKIADANPNVQILYPVHPNPNVLEVVKRELSGHPQIILADPLRYEDFVTTMKHATLILSDSGGVQEEAPALGTPVLVMRNTTERPEAIAVGAAKLVGTETGDIFEAAQKLLHDQKAYNKMVVGKSPFGDGKAAGRIVKIVEEFLR